MSVPEMQEEYQFGFHDDIEPVFTTGEGLSEEVIREISRAKGEPEWMLDFRLKSLETFRKLDMPNYGPDLSELDYDKINYFIRSSDKPARDWDDVPEEIKTTFERLGIPEAERAYLAGASAQYESEVVYHNMKDEFTKLGIVFTDTDSALKEYPELFKEYFGTLVPPSDNKLAALNSAAWSGGTFIYVPKRCENRYSDPVVLPYQLGKYRTIRTYTDHRRRRCQHQLCRRLYGSNVFF